MGPQKESFAARVLRAVAEIGGEVATQAIFHYLGLQTRAAEKKALNALSDLFKAGRVVRVRPATYSLPVAKCLDQKVSKQARMWAVLRFRKRVTVADLQELAEVSLDYAEDWLRTLVKREVVKRIDQPGNRPSIWQLINDTVKMPDLTDNADRLRAIRGKRKLALLALAKAAVAIEEAKQALIAINEGEETHA